MPTHQPTYNKIEENNKYSTNARNLPSQLCSALLCLSACLLACSVFAQPALHVYPSILYSLTSKENRGRERDIDNYA